MLARLDPSHVPAMLELDPNVPPMIALAVGTQAIACGPGMLDAGEETMKMCFGDDLGFTRESWWRV